MSRIILLPPDSLDEMILDVLRESPRLGRDSGDEIFADIDPDPDVSKIEVTEGDLILARQLPWRLTKPASATASR